MGRVSLSTRDAWVALYVLRGEPTSEVERRRTEASLKSALSPRPKKPERRERERKQAQKKATKREETAAIREAVVERAADLCECCQKRLTESDPGEMDHFWGRGKAPQSVENCWLLCRDCHRSKTNNYPDAGGWLDEFRDHATFHGYAAEAAKARRRLESLALSRASAGAGKGGGM